MKDKYKCPSCGSLLQLNLGVDEQGRDEHTFQCFSMDCLETYEADEIMGGIQ